MISGQVTLTQTRTLFKLNSLMYTKGHQANQANTAGKNGRKEWYTVSLKLRLPQAAADSNDYSRHPAQRARLRPSLSAPLCDCICPGAWVAAPQVRQRQAEVAIRHLGPVLLLEVSNPSPGA